MNDITLYSILNDASPLSVDDTTKELLNRIYKDHTDQAASFKLHDIFNALLAPQSEEYISAAKNLIIHFNKDMDVNNSVHGDTLLAFALRRGDQELLDLVLAFKDLDVNMGFEYIWTEESMTAAHTAVRYGITDSVIKLLEDKRFNPSAQDQDGLTILGYTLETQDPCINLLNAISNYYLNNKDVIFIPGDGEHNMLINLIRDKNSSKQLKVATRKVLVTLYTQKKDQVANLQLCTQPPLSPAGTATRESPSALEMAGDVSPKKKFKFEE